MSDAASAPDAAASPPGLSVFVYGTLKEGFENHAHFCRGAVSIQPAETWGRLYLWAPNIPILAVPDDQVLLSGTADLDEDVEAERRFARLPIDPDPFATPDRKGWRRIRGELAVFPDPQRRLAILDALEGFRPRTRPDYARVLLPIRVLPSELAGPRLQAAWAYVLPAGVPPSGAALDVEVWTPGTTSP
jgi:gamma-glutamylcyclotransferase (GGCT)/AIG2-like uncharacterized protein YtfP